MGKVDLGDKLTCSSCGARYYDLKKSPAECPKCGNENEPPKTFRVKRTGPAAPKPVKQTPAPSSDDANKPGDIDDIEDIETDDDDDDLIDDAAGVDEDDDDDVDSVIGPIDSSEENSS